MSATICQTVLTKAYDIVIVGAGLVGLSLSLLLKQDFKSILLIDKRKVEVDITSSNSTDLYINKKSIALSMSSIEIIRQLDLWNELEKVAAKIERVHVSGNGDVGAVLLSACELDQKALGYNVSTAIFSQSLIKSVKNSQVEVLSESSVENIIFKKEHVEIEVLQTQNSRVANFNSKLLIMCDGVDSKVFDFLGVQKSDFESDYEAISTNIDLQQPHQNIAYQRFSKKGHMALLPIPKDKHTNRVELVWVLKKKLANEFSSLSDEDFLKYVQDNFGYRLGVFEKIDQRLKFPIIRQQSMEQIRNGLVILGNAANSIYPIGAQGFNLALRDVNNLVTVLKSALTAKKHIGTFEVLDQYYQSKKNDQELTTCFGDSLESIFSHHNLHVRALRSLGLLAIDIVPFLRKKVTKFGVGVR